jgi:hypothetical protein
VEYEICNGGQATMVTKVGDAAVVT